MAGVVSFGVNVSMVATVIARQDAVKLDVPMTDGALAVYLVIAILYIINSELALEAMSLYVIVNGLFVI